MSVEEPTIGDVAAWAEELAQAHSRIGFRFGCAEPRRRARAYQSLLCTAEWDADAVRDDLVAYVR